MARIIQAQAGCVNIIVDTQPVGKQIEHTLSTDCVARVIKKKSPVEDVIQFLDRKGMPTASVQYTAALQLQDVGGPPAVWVGTIDELVNKLNNEYFVTSVSTTPPVGGSTSALQETLNDQTAAKKIGYVLDLEADSGGNWAGFPIGFSQCIFTYSDKIVEFEGGSKNLANTKELADFLNDNQTDLVFAELEEDKKLYFVGTTDIAPEIEEISLDETISAGNIIEYFAPFLDTTDQPTGAIHEVVTFLQKQQQVLRQLTEAIPIKENAICLSYNGNVTKNLTTDPDRDGKKITSGSVGEIVRVFNLAAGTVQYRLDGGVPSGLYPSISANETFNSIPNVDFDNFRIAGTAGASNYAIIINLYKKQ